MINGWYFIWVLKIGQFGVSFVPMTERKRQRKWLNEFFRSWPEDGVSRRKSAAKAFHEHILHSDETGNPRDYIKQIIRIELDDVTLVRLRKYHSLQTPHKLDPSSD